MKTLTLLLYIVVLVMVIILFSGLLLPSPDSTDKFGVFVGAVLLLIFAAALPLFFWKEEHHPERIYIYLSCIMLLSAVQITGGGIKSILFPVYFLFLMWVSLPSVKGPTVALGLGIGIIEGFAPIAKRISEYESLFGNVTVFTDFIKVFLSLFCFALIAGRLSKIDLSFLPGRDLTISPGKSKRKTALSFPISAVSHFLPMMHRNSHAATTCLFVKYDNHSYQLVASAGSPGEIISKYMLSVDGPIIEKILSLKKSCLLNVQEGETNSVSAVYRNKRKNDICKIAVTPVFRSDEMAAFFLQDFSVGSEPNETTFRYLEDAVTACLSIMSGKTETAGKESVASWTEELVEIVGRGTKKTLVKNVSLHLAEFMKGVTISILEVDISKGLLYVWIRKGPLSRGNRKEKLSISDGVAGWCVRNASPCTRLHMKQGNKKAYSFSKADDPFDEVNSCIAVPLMDNGSVVGLIMAEHGREDYFSSEHSHLLKTAAGILSLGLAYISLKTKQKNINGRDTLTGLPGAAILQRHLANLIKIVRASGSYIGLLIIDIDDFRMLNLKYGYTEGDRILLETAKRFRNCLNHDVFIAKIGPDSFAACIPGAEKHDLEALSSRIADNLNWEHRTLSDKLCTVSVSIGAAFTHTDRKVLTLIAESEKAVEIAKNQQDSCYFVFSIKAFGTTLLKSDSL